MKQPLRLRWVLGHIPYDLFLRSANIFAKKLHEKTDGMVEIEIMGIDELNDRHLIPQGKAPIEHGYQLIELVNNGTIDMSQLLNTEMCNINKNMEVLELPFLFRDHDHATKVLDGEIGMGLLNDLSKNSNIKGLAFTYSGGFRMVVSTQPLSSVDDFAGKKVRTSWGAVAKNTFKVLDAETVNVRISETANAIRNNIVDSGENTWARFYRTGLNDVAKYVSETKHSLFLTCVIMNSKIWENFDPEVQAFMQEAALEAALGERVEALVDGEQAKQQAINDGIIVQEWDEVQHARLRQITLSTYDSYRDHFDAGLIDAIKNVH